MNLKTQDRIKFSLTTKDGLTLTFGSLLEAKAAQVRAGGGQISTVKKV